MTATQQNFVIYAGDYTVPIFCIVDGNDNPLDISGVPDITWSARRTLESAPVITKTLSGGDITRGQNKGEFSVKILPEDTQNLTGFYMHTAKLLIEFDEPSTVTLGRMQVGEAPAWSYSGDPSSSTRDAVRTYIGDTDPNVALFSDPQIDFFLAQFGSPLYAAAQACRVLAQRFAAKVSKRVGDLSISNSDLSKNYREMAAEFQAQAEQSGSIVYAGGISKSDMKANAENPDRYASPFKLDEFNNKGAIGGITNPSVGGGPESEN